jgi:succinate-acetate transporter protein
MEASVAQGPGRTAGAQDPTRDGTARAEERVIRTQPVTADPGPLGLAAFALTTFVLSMFNSGLQSEKGLPIVLGLALAYGGLAQLLAGMWEFRTGNTFGATAFTSYGAFWLSFWAFEQFFAKDITDKATLGHSVGLFLIGWGIFTTYMLVAAFRVSVGVVVVLLLLAITFFLLGFGNTGPHPNLVKWGGYFGLATAAMAWYVSFAGVLSASFGRTILPVKPLNG